MEGEIFEEIIDDNFSELLNDMKPQIQKLQPVTHKINDKKNPPEAHHVKLQERL